VAIRGALLRHPVAMIGVVMTTASAVVFIALFIAMLLGMLVNPYAGLVVFVAIPGAFVAGLLLIPYGMWLQRRKLVRYPSVAAEEWPVLDFRRADVRRTALLLIALSGVNIVVILLAGYGTLHWMESPTFCGQVCHKPMEPQFAAWQRSPHAGVPCAACHVGDGARGFLRAKLSGVQQLAHVATNSYPIPIPPGADMPPGAQAQTCSNCHKLERPVGDRIRVIREYADDEKSSETMTVLQMHVNASTDSPRAIHWHANSSVQIEYVATDAERQTIPYVKVTGVNGQVKEYIAPDTTEQMIGSGTRRRMDCIDCHNTVGHPISPTAEQAVDRAIATAVVSQELPFARREGLRLVKASYDTQEDGALSIERGLRSFYETQGSAIDQRALARSATALQELYRRNVFPGMNVTWGTYPTNIGHVTSNGCFRCHDDSHKAEDGSTISADCGLCHTQIERP
jgi:hypothetical protein